MPLYAVKYWVVMGLRLIQTLIRTLTTNPVACFSLREFPAIYPTASPPSHRIKISNRRATQRCNVSAFFYAKICSLLARRRSSQPVQRVYWPENVIDWLGKWRPTCVTRKDRNFKASDVSGPSIWIFILYFYVQAKPITFITKTFV